MGNIYIDNRGTSGGVSGGGCFPAILSFLLPGAGQLLNGHIGKAIGHFVVAAFLWIILLGWIVHFYSAFDASKG